MNYSGVNKHLNINLFSADNEQEHHHLVSDERRYEKTLKERILKSPEPE
jgi:hypothetical protein